jgi:hypothetical protein
MAQPGLNVPRATVPIGILVLVAAAWFLWGERQDNKAKRLDDGGPLVPFPAQDVVRIEVQHHGQNINLVKFGETWQLTGQVQDRTDPLAVAGWLTSVCSAATSPVLFSSPLSAQRYGLTPATAWSLDLYRPEGPPLNLLVGTQNPVSGHHYATGAGRSGVFAVTSDLVQKLSALPTGVRLRSLWPAFEIAAVETVRLRSGRDQPDCLVRGSDGRWWLRQPADGTRRLGWLVQAYTPHYQDRRQDLAGQIFWLANARQIDKLCHYLGRTQVGKFGPAPASQAEMTAAGLNPPTATVSLVLRGEAEPLQADLGSEVDNDLVAARREGLNNLLFLQGKVKPLLMAPLAEFLETDVFGFAWAVVDSFLLQGEPGQTIKAIRSDTGWRSSGAPGSSLPLSAKQAGVILRDLELYFERLAIQEVFPAHPDSCPLVLAGQTSLTAWGAFPGGATALEAVFGTLLPGPQTAVYFPETGQLLGIAPDLLITYRSVFTAFGQPNH